MDAAIAEEAFPVERDSMDEDGGHHDEWRRKLVVGDRVRSAMSDMSVLQGHKI